MLVHPHAPQTRYADVPSTEEIRQHADILGRDARDLLDLFGGVFGDALFELVEGDRLAVQRGVRGGEPGEERVRSLGVWVGLGSGEGVGVRVRSKGWGFGED